MRSPSFKPAKIAVTGKQKDIKRLTVCHQYKLRDKYYLSVINPSFVSCSSSMLGFIEGKLYHRVFFLIQ